MQKTLVLDSTQLEAFDTCPQLWEYAHHESLITIESEETSVDSPLVCGSFAHKLLEVFYHAKATCKNPVFKSNLECGIYMMDHWLPPADFKEVTPTMQKKIRDRLTFYWQTYSQNDVTPAYDTIEGINDNFEPIRIKAEPMVERGFSYELLNTKEYLFVLEGKIDLIFTEHGGGFMDHKTQFRARNLYKKSFQFRNYSLATGKRLGIINYIRFHDKVEKNTLCRELISFSPQEMWEWKEELTEIYIDITKEIGREQLTKRRSQCSGKFGYACAFTQLCEEPNLDLKSRIKSAMYKQKEEWKPW